MITQKTDILHRIRALVTQGAISHVLRWILALIFIYSGIIKLTDPPRFVQIIAGFGLLPKPLLMPAAVLLPLAELLAGVGLLFRKRGSLTAITLMLLMFMTVLIYGIHLGLDIDCGCFGPEDPEQAYKGLKPALARDALMMVASGYLYWRKREGATHNTPSQSEV